MTAGAGTILWLAGVGWDQITGTDKRIVKQIGLIRPVVWIDPPVAISPARLTLGASAPEAVAPGVTRIRVTVLPGVTRRGIRLVTASIVDRVVAKLLAALSQATVVVAFPLARFPSGEDVTRVLYVTDDWLDGAGLMGLSRDLVRKTLRVNLADAHAIAAVTPALLHLLAEIQPMAPGATARVVANGAPASSSAPVQRTPVAGLVGQINERLDLGLLERLVEHGIGVRMIGPRTDRDVEFGSRLDHLISSAGVEWVGAVPQSDLPEQLARLGVGLTPYTDTPFNRASFPLKTLEYLSAGLAVVSSDLPASRWIDSPHVRVTSTPDEFVDAVIAALDSPSDVRLDDDRRSLAALHSWKRRAEEFLELVDSRRKTLG